MSKWFIMTDAGRLGPFTHDELRGTLQTFSVPGEVLVKSDEDISFGKARDVAGLLKEGLTAPELPKPNHRSAPNSSRPAKWRWLKVAAAIGVGLGVLSLLGSSDVAASAEGISYAVGRLISTTALCALLGLAAGALRDLFKKPAPAFGTTPQAVTGSGWNVIARHWRGQYPLWISYWVINFLVAVVAVVVSAALALTFRAESGYEPVSIFAIFAGIWITICVLGLWQVIGLWRAANNHISRSAAVGKGAPWARLAKFAAILMALQYVGTFSTEGLPQLREATRMAFLGDPDMQDYSFRIMRNGTEVEIIGGFKYGLTNDFEKLLKASRQVRVVHLDSVGGRIGEAIKLNRVIRDRGLITYVSSRCASACTLAFAAGRERYIAKGATLAFHAPAFPGMDKETLEDSVREQTQYFRSAGFGSDFVRKALSTPSSEFWKPTVDELYAAKVINGVSDGTQFAASGFGNVSREEMANKLARISPVFSALRTRLPMSYEGLVEAYYQSYLAGDTEARGIDVVRSKIVPVIEGMKPLAGDDVLQELAVLTADTMSALGIKSPSLCYNVAHDAKKAVDYRAAIPEGLIKRELALYERIINTAQKRPPVSSNDVEKLMPRVRMLMVGMGASEDDVDIFAGGTATPAQYGSFCKGVSAFFKVIGTLPQKESALIMRQILSEK